MPITAAIMVPHPPLIVPEVGRGGEQQIAQTSEAYLQAARFVVDSRPDTVVITTPHSVLYQDYLHISPGDGAKGSFRRFGAPQVALQVSYDRALVTELSLMVAQAGFPAGTEGERDKELDHGTLVPLFFLRQAAGGELPFKVVRVGHSGLPGETHYRLGMMISQAAQRLGRRVALVASGDLSHYLTPDGPYGYRAEGPQYDERVMDIMGRAAFDELMEMPQALCEAAGECGQRSFQILAGALDGLDVAPSRLSYQGVTGVGYGVVTFRPEGADDNRCFLEKKNSNAPSAPVRLARQSYEHYVRTGKRLALPHDVPGWLTDLRAGAFVTLHRFGELRGCVGTISPTQESAAEEILRNAVSAAVEDPRFSPVKPDELADITCSVDILAAPEPIDSEDQLDPQVYGVIVSRGSRRGLLLPMLEGVDTVRQQVDIARQKAGIRPGEAASLQRFKVTRYT